MARSLCAGVMLALILTPGCARFQASDEEIIHVDEQYNRRAAERKNRRGIHWLETGYIELAKRSFEKSLRADETYGPAHSNLGLIYYRAGDMYQAALAFESASTYMPGNPVPLNNLGLALESGGKLVEALTYYQQAHDLNPTEEEFLGNLVRARLRLGQCDETVIMQLRELRFIETRPEWIDWIDEQLAINFNPYLDRGPVGPEFSPLDDSEDNGTSADEPSDSPPEEGIPQEPIMPRPDPNLEGPGPSLPLPPLPQPRELQSDDVDPGSAGGSPQIGLNTPAELPG